MEPAGPARVERRLAAILAADVAGYSRLIGADEEGTLGRLKALRAELIDPKIADASRPHRQDHRRRPLWSSSPASSTRCDARPKCRRRWPKAMPSCRRTAASSSASASTSATSSSRTATSSATASTSRRGLEGLAEPGGICVSARVQEDAAGRLDLAFEDMGEQTLKNIARPVRILPGSCDPHPPRRQRASPPLPQCVKAGDIVDRCSGTWWTG